MTVVQDGLLPDGSKGELNELVSLKSAQRIMRLPETRDHDNDKENFCSISIIPTTSELQCKEATFLPSAGFTVYPEQVEAAALDRHNVLMHENLLGTLKEELKAEFHIATHQRRRLMPEPCIIDFSMKPEPHVVVRVSILYHISRRIQSMKNSEATMFFEEGPGKKNSSEEHPSVTCKRK